MLTEQEIYNIVSVFAKQGASADKLSYVFKHLQNGNGELSAGMAQKIVGIINGTDKRERNLSKEIEDWILLQDGYINVTNCYNELQLVTKEQKTAARVNLHRLCNKGIIEKHGLQSGTYRKVDKDWENMDWYNAPTNELFINFPLGVHDFAKIYPKNIILLSGVANAGKTSYALEFARLNKQRFNTKIRYISSEMGPTELKNRLLLYPQDIPTMALDSWRDIEFIERSENYPDLITQEERIFIIDYLELYDDVYRMAGIINDIFRRLDKGIAFVIIQKDPKKEHGWGGQATKHKARLAMDLERGKLVLKKVKSFRGEHNPDGIYREFKLVSGWKFLPQETWQGKDEDGFTKEKKRG